MARHRSLASQVTINRSATKCLPVCPGKIYPTVVTWLLGNKRSNTNKKFLPDRPKRDPGRRKRKEKNRNWKAFYVTRKRNKLKVTYLLIYAFI